MGTFAVWRFPVMQTSDLQLWRAVTLPKWAKRVPNNCVICTCKGSGAVALGGGDYDGDLLMFTSNKHLLKFLRSTPEALPEFERERTYIKSLVGEINATPLHSLMDFRYQCLTTPTPRVRGMLTAMTERAQQAAFLSESPGSDGSLQWAFRLAVAAEKAYDAPKKVKSKEIVSLGMKLLSEAGLSNSSPRSTTAISQEHFMLDEADIDPAQVLMSLMPPDFKLGKVWLPLNEIVLSSEAGTAMHQRMFHSAKPMYSLNDPSEKVPLDEVSGALAHRMANAGKLRELVQAGDPAALIEAAQKFDEAKPKAINKPPCLVKSSLP